MDLNRDTGGERPQYSSFEHAETDALLDAEQERGAMTWAAAMRDLRTLVQDARALADGMPRRMRLRADDVGVLDLTLTLARIERVVQHHFPIVAALPKLATPVTAHRLQDWADALEEIANAD